jgi:hypothetical protein
MVGDREVLKSPTIIMLTSICVFKSSLFFMKFDALTLGTHKLTIVIYSWNIILLLVWSDLLCLFWLI